MSEPFVSVVVPTHDHGPTLRLSIGSALAQTHADLEVLIVGDGMPPAALEIARELEAADPRVRLFAFEKGDRHGEAHRHRVLTEHARGEFVLYLSDDDLWLPEHVASQLEILEAADLAAATMARADTSGRLRVTPHALEREAYLRLHLGAHNRVALSAIAHSRDAYERGPGWSPAPPGVYTDHHFLRGLLAIDDLRAASSPKVTWIGFPSPDRRELSTAERVGELERWWARIADPAARAELDRELEAAWRRAAVEFDELAINLTEAFEVHRATIASLEQRAEAAEAQLRELFGSRSWRLTAPVRSVADRLRRRR